MAPALRYLLTTALAAVGLLLSSALGLDLGGPRPPLAAVAIAALAAGLGPGLVCWLLSVAGYAFFFAEPRFAPWVANARDRADILEFAIEAGFVALALGGARLLYGREREERRRATRTADQLGRLQAVTAALSAARTPREAAEVVLGESADSLGASASAVAWRTAEGDLEFVAWRGYDDDAVRRVGRFGAEAPLPAARAFRDGQPVFLEAADDLLAFEGLRRVTGTEPRFHAHAALPLLLEGRVVGTLSFGFTRPRTFDAADRALFQALAHQCAQALERAYLFEAERAQGAAAERAKSQRDEVLEVVAHDLRSPINAVQLRAEALAARAGPHEAEALRAIVSAARRMERLVEDLLDDAALDAGRLALDRRPCDPTALAVEALEALRPAAERAGVRLALAAAGSVPAVDCDRGRAVQVLENLVANGLQVSPAGAAVTLAVGVRDGVVRFEVRDEGPGIPAHELPHVFDRWRRTRGARRKGSGLGLGIARGLVELHGGRIEAVSGPAGGAVFAVELPLA